MAKPEKKLDSIMEATDTIIFFAQPFCIFIHATFHGKSLKFRGSRGPVPIKIPNYPAGVNDDILEWTRKATPNFKPSMAVSHRIQRQAALPAVSILTKSESLFEV